MKRYILDQLENEGFQLDEDLERAIEEHAMTVYYAGVLDGQYNSSLNREATEFFESNPELETTIRA